MKLRTDFVTNSSSSSFIIDRKDCSYGKLLKCLKEMAQEDADSYNIGKIKWKDFQFDEEEGQPCIGNYFIAITTKDKPYDPIGEFDSTFEDYLDREKKIYDHAFEQDPIHNKPRTKQDIYDTAMKYYEEAKKQHDMWRAVWCSDSKKYDHHYVIDNKACARYDMFMVEDVLSRHKIPFEWGYCD